MAEAGAAAVATLPRRRPVRLVRDAVLSAPLLRRPGRWVYGLAQHRTIFGAAARVQARTGKSVRAQFAEIARLRRGPGRLTPVDYYAYELFDDDRYSPAQKREFVSWDPAALTAQVNEPRRREICDDKLLCYGLLRGLRLPHPEVLALYHAGGRRFGALPCLHTPEQMADFLRHGMRYPFFGKPAKDAFGRGATSVESIDRARDVLILHDGREVEVERWVREVPAARRGRRRPMLLPYDSGYLFQSRVAQHPVIDRLSGGRVSSLRMVVLLGPDGPRLFRATWKLPVGANITDHVIERSGNVKCAVDPDTGRVTRVVRGPGPQLQGAQPYGLGLHGTPIERHPDTGERLTDVQLPDWERAVALCLDAAAVFVGVRYQSWDLVLTRDGPMLLELNFNGGIAQVPGCRGLNDEQFRGWMGELGVRM